MLSKNLEFLRHHTGKSLDEAATKLGVADGVLAQWEEGTVSVPAETLTTLSDYYHTSLDRLLRHDLTQLPDTSSIKMVIFDIDGVMSDGGMYYTEHGDHFKKFNVKDGLAIKKLAKEGYELGIISAGLNLKLIETRAKILDIPHVHSGPDSKIEVFTKWCSELNILPSEVAYIGDDLTDLDMIRAVGLSACPANAVDQVKSEANIVLSRNGGDACVREFIQEYLRPDLFF